MTFPGVDKMIIADLHGEAAQEFASTLDGNIEALQLDVADETAMRAAMSEADVVLNTTGPFYKFGPPILKAAIRCKCHYLDICDDWEPTLDMLQMDAAAREADVSAVIGLGASPGFSNLLGLVAMRELDTVEEVYTGWDMGRAIPEEETSQVGANAAMLHAIQQLTGTVRVFQNGEQRMARPLEDLEVDYPGVGTRRALIFGHPEAVTFPHHYPEIKTSLNICHGLDGDEKYIRLMRWFVERNILSTYNAARLLGWLEAQGAKTKVAKPLDPSRLPPIYGLAVGTKSGEPASAGAAVLGGAEEGMGFATGVPLAVGLRLLLEEKLTRRGVFAPESGAIDPNEFFEAMGEYNDLPAELAGINPVVTRSWDNGSRQHYTEIIQRVNAVAH
jgi:saccharopine dehydrogenase-like NADP-dependent oxidoreductase